MAAPRSLKIRIISAALMIPVVLGALAYGGIFYAVLLGGICGTCVSELWRLSLHSSRRWALFLVSAAFILVVTVAFYYMRDRYDVFVSFIFFFALWASDAGAYFAGKAFGGAKMTQAISPNKTWAGYAGALILPACVLCIAVKGVFVLPVLGGFALGIAGQAGDLIASAFKRYANVKNSGDLIPGHGGVLDRVDSLTLSVFVYLGLIEAGLFS